MNTYELSNIITLGVIILAGAGLYFVALYFVVRWAVSDGILAAKKRQKKSDKS